MIKKLLSILCTLCLLAGCLTGCGSSAPAASQSEARTAGFAPSMDTSASLTLEVYGSWSNFEALEAVAADWNELYPNVLINYTRINDYNKELDGLVSSPDKPDIVTFGTTSYYVNKEHLASCLLDLSDIGLDTSVFRSGVLSSAMYDGRMLALNWGMLAPGFVVNNDLLESLGLEVPSTHEEFVTVCDALKEAGYVPIQGCYINVYRHLLTNDRDARLASEADQEALYQMFDEVQPGCGKYFDREFQTMFQLRDKGIFDHELNLGIADIYDSSILHFFEGSTPFFCSTTEMVSGMKKRESKSEAFTAHPFRYSFVSLPVENETPALSQSAITGLAIVKDAPHADWAAEFLRFACSETELNKMASVKGVPGLTSSAQEDARFADLAALPQEAVFDADSYPVISLIDKPFEDTVWQIATGEYSTLEEAEQGFEYQMANYPRG